MKNEQRLLSEFTNGRMLLYTNKQLADVLGVCERQAKRYVHSLVQKGYISTQVVKFPIYGTWANQRKINVTVD